jgi:AcrR family transcriptional regulator
MSSADERSPAGTGKLRADAKRNRDAIVAAAREAFAAGDSGLRFDDFAGLAGVGTGTLYRHFPTRAALAAAVFRDEADALRRRASELGETLEPLDALETYLHEFVTYLDAHQGLASALARSTGPEAVADGGRAVEAAIGELVTRAVAAGTIRDDVHAGAVLIALHGITATHGQPDWTADAHGVVALVIDGLRIAPPEARP